VIVPRVNVSLALVPEQRAGGDQGGRLPDHRAREASILIAGNEEYRSANARDNSAGVELDPSSLNQPATAATPATPRAPYREG